jgi:5'-deoxynucleotidase YfbR-like HD superfamily hydrolase
MNVNDIYRSGFVQRYSSNPEMAHLGQNLGHHQWGVAVLMFALFKDRVDNMALIWEALHHDAGEMGAVDVSYPAKRKHPDLARAAADAEANERIDMGIGAAWLDDDETAMLKLCDRLESYLFARVRAPWVLPGDGWPELRAWCVGEAWRLGVGAEVEGLLA